MTKPTEPRRLRWSVPRADESTNRWLDEQHDISRSLQLLIRESIQRDGYIDVVNRPVEQLPRRGRPPQSETVDAESEPTTPPPAKGDDSDVSAVATQAQPATPAPIASEQPTDPANKAVEDLAPEESVPAGPTPPRPKPEAKKDMPSGLDAFLTR